VKAMKKLITLMLSLVLMMTLSACSSSKSNNDGSNTAVITVENYGKITVQLDPKQAPITVKNFKKLVHEKFYDGLTFHRIIQGFMIQGGDPNGDGTGGSDDTIKGEFSANGVKNTLKHKRGVISMARSSDYNSASSQFFIMQETNSSLDGQYAAFGKVTSGMDVVDKIANSVQVTDNNGSVAAKNQPVITSIRMKK
jgi:peptidyl-prolyl cis-trans isomerase B (cyclophilin B)